MTTGATSRNAGRCTTVTGPSSAGKAGPTLPSAAPATPGPLCTPPSARPSPEAASGSTRLAAKAPHQKRSEYATVSIEPRTTATSTTRPAADGSYQSDSRAASLAT